MISTLLFLEFVIWFGCLLHCQAKGQLSIVQPVTILLGYHFLFHLMKPALWYYFNHNHAFEYMQFYPNEEETVNSILVSTLGLSTSYLGYVFFFRYDNRKIRAILAPEINRAGISSTAHTLVLLVLAVSFVAFVQRMRGYLGSDEGFQLVQDARTGNFGFSQGSGWWYELSSAFVFCAMYLWMTSGFSRIWTIAVCGLGSLWLTLGSSRFVFVYCVMTGTILMITRSRLNLRKFLLLLPVGATLIVAFVVLGQNRAAIREIFFDTSSTERVTDDWKRVSPLDTLDMSTFEVQTAAVSIVPRLTDSYTYFTEHVRLLTEPIPRALWSSKPFGDPIKMIELNRFANMVTLSTGWYGQGWLSFGIVGIVATCLIYVMLSSFILRTLLSNAGPNAAFAYTVLIPLHLQWMRDGVLVSVVKFTLFLTLPAIIAAFVARHPSRSAQPYAMRRRISIDSRSQS
ncbi:hypothetical protein ACNJX9_31395 [Bradyrhizobium sp. DASA03076]|uniref:hypothetical protein n=1 Tax=Bradyrhizobium sp. BLXBL-03 TaxID=3395916 RepID=UPI003F6F2490